MSWSKFNDSLNSLKGQISTFVQETLVPEDEDEEAVPQGEVGVEQYLEICAAQENEVNSSGKLSREGLWGIWRVMWVVQEQWDVGLVYTQFVKLLRILNTVPDQIQMEENE